MVDIHWKLIGITIAVAAVSSITQLFLKDLSRPTSEDASITRDDFVIWTDWAVLGGLAFVLAVLGQSHAHPDKGLLTPTTILSGFVLILVAFVYLPWVLKKYGYDAEAKIKNFYWLACADVGGLLLLAGAVQSGISIYDFSGSASS